MRYIVTFRKRYDQAGDSAENPSTLVDAADGVILDSDVVQEIEPAGLGVTDDLGGEPGSENSNDDGFLAFGTESWIYEVADGREDEFINALRNSEVVLEFHDFDDEMIRKPFAQG